MSQDLYYRAFAVLPQSVLVCDAQGRIVDRNEAAQRLLDSVFVPESLLDVIDVGKHQALWEGYQQVVATQQTFQLEAQLAISNVAVTVTLTALEDHVLVTLVTQEHPPLTDTKHPYASILANAPGVVLAIDRQGYVTLCEGKGRAALGLQADRLLGQSLFEVYHDEPEMTRAANIALAGEVARFETYARSADAADTYLRVLFAPLTENNLDTNVIGAVAILHDISDFKYVRDNLERAQRIAHFGNFTLDLLTQEFEMSAHLYEMLEFPLEIVPTLELVSLLLAPGDDARMQETIQQAVSSQREQHVELTLTPPSGHSRVLRGIWQPVVDSQSNVVQLFGTLQDISDVKRTQQQLHMSNERLAFMQRLSHTLNRASSAEDILQALVYALDDPTAGIVRDFALHYIATDDSGQPRHSEIIAYYSSDMLWQTAEPGMRITISDYAGAHVWAANPNRLTVFADVARDTRLSEGEKTLFGQLGIATVVFMPLLQAGQWVGLVSMSWRELYTLSEDEQAILQTLARSLAPIVQNRRLVDDLEVRFSERSQELEQNRYLLRATIDNASALIFVKDTTGRYLLANQPLATLLNRDVDSIVGCTDSDFYAPEVVAVLRANDQTVITNATPVTLEEVVPTEQGERTYLATKFPLFDTQGEIFALGCITSDITEQKHAEARLQAYRDELMNNRAEMAIAQRVQELLLPSSEELIALQAHSDLDVAAYMRPAAQVGGDYYDIVPLGERINIAIGDVTGHGLESGLLMLMTQTAVRTLFLSGERDLRKILTTVNQTLFDNVERMQVNKSLTLALLTYREGCMQLCGQHEHLLLLRTNGDVEVIDTLDLGLPLALEADVSPFMAQRRLELHPGDTAILFTDGITEAESPLGEQFGLTRLTRALEYQPNQSAEATLDNLIATLYNHIAGAEIDDDISAVVVRRLPVRVG
jgi:PAS domain S-box-containing protein